MNLELALDPIVYAVLASVRLLAMFQVAPLFRETGVPGRVRASLALGVAFLMAPAPGEAVDWKTWGVIDLVLVMLVEVGIGLMIGLTTHLLFVGLLLLGNFISTQGGLSAARVIDPSSGVRSTALARMFNGFGVLIFVALDGHLELLRIVSLTFSEIPIGVSGPDLDGYLALVYSGSAMFEIAARLAAPITVTIFIQNVATSVLSKSLQQLNLMVVQLPAHIGIVLLIIGFGASDFVHGIKDLMEQAPGRVLAVVLGAA